MTYVYRMYTLFQVKSIDNSQATHAQIKQPHAHALHMSSDIKNHGTLYTCVMVYCEGSSRRSGCGLEWAWPSVVLALLPQA